MPLHEFTCKTCGAQFELLVRQDTPLVCPRCDGKHLSKNLSTFSVSVRESAPPPPPGCGNCAERGSGCPYSSG